MKKIDIKMEQEIYSGAEVKWFNPEEVFIQQTYTRGDDKEVAIFSWSEAQQVRDALNRFLEERAAASIARLNAMR